MAENFSELKDALIRGQLLVIVTPNGEDTYEAGVLYGAKSDLEDDTTDDFEDDQFFLALGRGLAFLAVDDPEFITGVGVEVLMNDSAQNAPSSDEIH
jgi:hypothetical protein